MVLWIALGSAAWAQEPPEEDESLVQKEYSFNPLQAQKEVQVGNYYLKKHSFRAAANRYREAIKWNPNDAEAYERLGEACDKLKDPAGAKQAYQKYLELAPNGGNADAAKAMLQTIGAEVQTKYVNPNAAKKPKK